MVVTVTLPAIGFPAAMGRPQRPGWVEYQLQTRELSVLRSALHAQPLTATLLTDFGPEILSCVQAGLVAEFNSPPKKTDTATLKLTDIGAQVAQRCGL